MDRDEAWRRARQALITYERENGLTSSGRSALLTDLLALMEAPTLEVELAAAAHRAGIHIATGKLRIEQDIFARTGTA